MDIISYKLQYPVSKWDIGTIICNPFAFVNITKAEKVRDAKSFLIQYSLIFIDICVTFR